MEKQKNSVADTNELLKDLMIGIGNSGDNMKTYKKEMDYWRNPEVLEAEEELGRLQDETHLYAQASKRPESVNVSLPEDQSPFPTQRQNLFPMGCLEGILASTTAWESKLPPLSADLERVLAL